MDISFDPNCQDPAQAPHGEPAPGTYAKPYALDHALAYAKLGLPVLPLKPGTKAPATTHGFKDATTNLDTIHRWYKELPDAGVGIFPGPLPLVILDVDDKEGKPGIHELEELERQHGPLPPTLVQRTPSGRGFHLFFILPDGTSLRNASPWTGIDVRASAGYVAAEPTRIRLDDGTERHYSFQDWDILAGKPPVVAKAPEWLLNLLVVANANTASDHVEEGDAEQREQVTPQQVTELRSALNSLNADEYNAWVNTGLALKSLGNTGRGLWMTWSQQSQSKFDPHEASKKWASFKPERTGYAAVFKAAQGCGWINPASKVAYLQPSFAAAEPVAFAPFTAADLKDMKFEPIRWCVMDILPEGTFLLSAKPKIGKSWLALQIALAIALIGYVLGKTVEMGSVLVLALEDNKRRLQSRLNSLQAFFIGTPDALKRLHLQTEWPRAHEGGVEAIEAWLQVNPDARLVVIDTLARFRQPGGSKGSLYEHDYQALVPLKTLSDKYRVTILIITHNRKMEADDPLDVVSGTLGLSGSADGVLVIERPRHSNKATLHVSGRDIENEGAFAISFNRTLCMWEMVGDAVEVTKSPERDEILLIFKKEQRPLRRKDVVELSGRLNGTVGRLLAEMVAAGNLESQKRGLYQLPGTSSAPAEDGETEEQGEQGEQSEQGGDDDQGLSRGEVVKGEQAGAAALTAVDPAEMPTELHPQKITRKSRTAATKRAKKANESNDAKKATGASSSRATNKRSKSKMAASTTKAPKDKAVATAAPKPARSSGGGAKAAASRKTSTAKKKPARTTVAKGNGG